MSKGKLINQRLDELCSSLEPGQVLTQDEIAEYWGCSRTLIGSIEKRAKEKFRKIALRKGLNTFLEA